MPEARDNPAEREALEEALASALAAHEAGGTTALEQFLARHDDPGGGLREALGDLASVHLLSPGRRERAAGFPAAGLLGTDALPTRSLPIQFGEFRVKALLGVGGMGVVYLAEQPSLGREVALKVVRPELLFFDGARERFRREIDAVARLEHPAIVPILATGLTDGVPYYAMPRIRGTSAEAVVAALSGGAPAPRTGAELRAVLAAAVDGVPADGEEVFAGRYWQTVVRLVRQAALGIAHAHSRGILHRDLKPSNLMLTASGHAVVLDFGLAHASGDAHLTRTGSAAGSPVYMAPELLRGEPADERSDVYGLAATLHCLLARRPPFDAVEPEALRAQILAGARPDPVRAADGPPELRLVLACALDVERARRYPSAGAFADDLQAVLDGRPLAARPLPLGVRVRRVVGRHRASTTAAVALLVFATALPALLWWQQRIANAALTTQVERAQRSTRISVEAVERLLAAVARNRIMHVPAGQDVAAEMLESAVSLFEVLAADAAEVDRVHDLRIRTLLRLAQVEIARGDLDAAQAAAERAVSLCGHDRLTGPRAERQQPDGQQPDGQHLANAARMRRGHARAVLAGVLGDRGERDRRAQLAAQSRADLEPLLADPELRDRARGQLANLHFSDAVEAERRGDAAARERALRLALEHVDEQRDPLGVATTLAGLCQCVRQQGRTNESLSIAESAVRLASRADVPEHGWPCPRRVEAYARFEHAESLKALDREDEAIEQLRLSVRHYDAYLRIYPDELDGHRNRGAAANNLALLLSKRGELAEARTLLEAACADQLAVLARRAGDAVSREWLLRHRRALCHCLYRLGDYAALEARARELGAMPGTGLAPHAAAFGMLRCAAGGAPERSAALRGEALDLLEEAHRRGDRIDRDQPEFAPLRDDPRFLRIATPPDR